MSIEGWAIVASILGGFVVHLVYFGRGIGKMQSDIEHLANSFDDFRGQHYIPRQEYEARHQDLIVMLKGKDK